MIIINESYSITNNLGLILKKFISKTGVHNGGDCAFVAKCIADYLSEMDAYDYDYCGTITDGAIDHVFIKFRGKYYDGVRGEFKPSGKVVNNLKDTGKSIGNDQYNYINYQYGSTSYKSSSLYKTFMSIADEVEDQY